MSYKPSRGDLVIVAKDYFGRYSTTNFIAEVCHKISNYVTSEDVYSVRVSDQPGLLFARLEDIKPLFET